MDAEPGGADQSMSEKFSDFTERLEDAAIEAEIDTGVVELTEEKAKANIALRLVRITAGFIAIIAGVAMMVLPGPGIVTIAGGLALLSRDFVWAEKTLRYVRRVAPGVPEDGKIPTRTWVVTILMLAIAAVGSLWWYVLR